MNETCYVPLEEPAYQYSVTIADLNSVSCTGFLSSDDFDFFSFEIRIETEFSVISNNENVVHRSYYHSGAGKLCKLSSS